MKWKYAFGILLVAFMLESCKEKASNQSEPEKESNETQKVSIGENPYEGLRNLSLSANPKELGLSLDPTKTVVYGIVMDWEVGGAIATTVSYLTGDASLYVSTGAAVIGGFQHKNVNSAAKQFVKTAESFLEKAVKTEATVLPSTGEVKFYILTNKGIFFGGDKIENLENGSSPWMKLFNEGNKVMAELRKVAPK